MKRLLAVVVIMTSVAVFAQSQVPDPASLSPMLTVSVGPYRGYIPARFANGRPVYQFSALVMDEEQRYGLASARVLLQAGDTETMSSKSGLTGKIMLDGRGAVRYDVKYKRDGRVVLATNASLQLIE